MAPYAFMAPHTKILSLDLVMPPPPAPTRFPSDQEWVTSLMAEDRPNDTEEQRRAYHDGAFHKYDIAADNNSSEGAFGTVFKAFLRTDRTKPVAVKVIKQKKVPTVAAAKRVFNYEISALKALENHENICSLYEVFVTVTGTLHLVLEYADFGSLAPFLVSNVTFAAAAVPLSSEAFAGSIMFQPCTAMKYIHSQGIIHRDIKPANILIASKDPPILKVGDFGTALRSSMAVGATGTFGYMAPEVLSKEVYDHRADVYSVGVVFFNVLLRTYDESSSSDALLKDWEKEIRGRGKYLGALKIVGNRTRFLNTWDELQQANDRAMELAKGLLEVDPNNRISMTDVLSNPWPRAMNDTHSPANSGNVDQETDTPTNSSLVRTRSATPEHASRRRHPAAFIGTASHNPAEAKLESDVGEPTIQDPPARFIEIGPRRRRLA